MQKVVRRNSQILYRIRAELRVSLFDKFAQLERK